MWLLRQEVPYVSEQVETQMLLEIGDSERMVLDSNGDIGVGGITFSFTTGGGISEEKLWRTVMVAVET